MDEPLDSRSSSGTGSIVGAINSSSKPSSSGMLGGAIMIESDSSTIGSSVIKPDEGRSMAEESSSS